MWQGYKTDEDILSGLEINPVVKKIQSHRNKWIQHVRQKDRDRLSQLIVTCKPSWKRGQERPFRRLLDC